MDPRPAAIGHYGVLTDFEAPGASVRVLRLDRQSSIEPHVHHRCAQIYVAIEGLVAIVKDGVEFELAPFACLEVPANHVHTARALSPVAIVVNVSVPPLDADDQLPA